MVAIADRAGCAPVPLTARVRGYSDRALPRSGDPERGEWIAMADAALLARSCRSGISELMQECGAALHTHQPHEAQGGPPRSFRRSRVIMIHRRSVSPLDLVWLVQRLHRLFRVNLIRRKPWTTARRIAVEGRKSRSHAKLQAKEAVRAPRCIGRMPARGDTRRQGQVRLDPSAGPSLSTCAGRY